VFLIVLVSPTAKVAGEAGVMVTVVAVVVFDPGGGGIGVDGASAACTGPVAGTVVS